MLDTELGEITSDEICSEIRFRLSWLGIPLWATAEHGILSLRHTFTSVCGGFINN